MSVYRDKDSGCFVFEFSRRIGGQRVRARKALPKSWTRAQADAFDRKESARLYATANQVGEQSFSISEAVTRYIKERVPHLKRGEDTAAELALMFWAYDGEPMSALADVCRTYALEGRSARGERLSPATVRNRIRYLTAACRYAWKHCGMGKEDPAARVVVPPVRNERQHYVDRREMLTIARACRHRMARMAIRIAFYSGMRLSEILAAKPTARSWVLADTKNGTPRRVPIHPRVAVCARRFVPCPKITIQSNWSKARDATGHQGLHFHDLRHSAASELINAGVDLYTVGRVLGHKDSRSTARYSHLEESTLATAVERIGKRSA